MADFLSNLFLRSSSDQPSAAILRPRLPSLFEPLRNTDQNLGPVLNHVMRDNFSSSKETRADEVSIDPSLVTPGNSSSSTLASTDHWLTSKPTTPDAVEKIGQSSQPIRHFMTESFLEEPQQTIIPVSAREISLKSKSRSLESHSIASNENEELLEGGFHPMGLEAGEENMSPSKRVEKYLEPRIENVKKENTLADEVVHLKNGSVHINAKLKPVATAQHSPTERQKVERVQERLQVVEVHIGRIEVRAMPATTQTKRPSQPAGIMTLDEYLRSRSREK